MRTGLIEPAANPATAKDLFVSGVSGGVYLSAANTTRYTKITPLQLDRGFYSAPTANAVGMAFYANGVASAASMNADLGLVAAGDVYAVRIRAAEFAVLRILSVKPSVAGSNARLRFEYKMLEEAGELSAARGRKVAHSAHVARRVRRCPYSV